MVTTITPKVNSTTEPLRERPTLVKPLQQLASSIRRYIVAEGFAWFLLGVAGWCLLSFAFDWGFLFRLLGVDYLRDGLVEGHRVARVCAFIMLAFGALGILAYHVIYRAGARFRPVDLALVLERRFPGILGDRLVTALELGDRRVAEASDLSWPLIESAVNEAETRVAQVHLAEVFDRQRLTRLLTCASILAVSFALIGILNADAMLTWVDRNLLLRDAFWPQPALLVVEGFPTDRVRAVPFGSELRTSLRAWKWVVKTRENAEGWRPLEWLRDLMPGSESQRPWELKGELVSPRVFAALPPAWQRMTLDEIDARVVPKGSFATHRREVGHAVATYLKAEIATGRPLELPMRRMLGLEESASEPDHASIIAKLDAALRIPAPAAMTLSKAIRADRLLPEDFVWIATYFSSTLPLPVLPAVAIQKVEAAAHVSSPARLTHEEFQLLPTPWRELPRDELLAALQRLADIDSLEAYADRLRVELLELFDELDRRAGQPHFGRRSFRRLEVPPRVTLEFEQILEAEERGRSRPKRGQPEIRKQEGDFTFTYEFKKVEQPLRFRAWGAGVRTAWHEVLVRPLPALKWVRRWHNEPGYLHASNTRVTTGPFQMALDGGDLRGDAPAGSLVQIEAECYKPLQSLRLVADNPLDPSPGELLHQPGAMNFSIRLRPLGDGEMRFHLEMLDADGIAATRKIVLMGQPDREPSFARTTFEVVNRKMITPQAILPLSTLLRDDHGLTDAAYDVTVESADRKPLYRTRVPLRTFQAWEFVTLNRGQFEKATDATASRVLATGGGMRLAAVGALLQLPQGGVPLLWPAPHLSQPTELQAAYEDTNLYGPVLRPDHEFLDTLLVRQATAPSSDQVTWPTPYRLAIRLSALDNRRDESTGSVPAFQEGLSAEVYDFVVVSEQELLIEVGKREEEIRDRCEEVLGNLRKLRGQMTKMHDDFDTFSSADRQRAAADAQDFQRMMANLRRQTDERVLREFRQVYRELALNRVQEKVLDRIDTRVCLPLAQLTASGGMFSQATDALEQLAKRIEADQNLARSVILEAAVPVDRLIERLEQVMNEMQKLIEFNQAVQALRELILTMENNLKAIEELRKKKQREELEP